MWVCSCFVYERVDFCVSVCVCVFMCAQDARMYAWCSGSVCFVASRVLFLGVALAGRMKSRIGCGFLEG